jgi:hypothetical protein
MLSVSCPLYEEWVLDVTGADVNFEHPSYHFTTLTAMVLGVLVDDGHRTSVIIRVQSLAVGRDSQVSPKLASTIHVILTLWPEISTDAMYI